MNTVYLLWDHACGTVRGVFSSMEKLAEFVKGGKSALGDSIEEVDNCLLAYRLTVDTPTDAVGIYPHIPGQEPIDIPSS